VAKLGEGVARRLLGDLAYRSEQLREAVTEVGVLFSDRARQVAMWRQPARRDRYLELEAGVKSWRDVGYHAGGTGDEDRDKICAYTYALSVNRRLDRPQGRIRELWSLT